MKQDTRMPASASRRTTGAMGEGDAEHLLGRRHFEVQRNLQPGHQRVDVGIGDVPAILAQMGGDAVGAGLRRGEGGADRIGMRAAARVPDGRDMVDIDAETQGSGHAPSTRLGTGALRLPGFSAGKAASSSGRSEAS